MDTNTAQSAPSAPTVQSSLANLGKRQQVARANQMIFIWVSAASVLIVACVIAALFLGRVGLFNQRIISAQSATNKTILQNIENADQLKKNVDNLIANNDLQSVRAVPTDSNLKVIFDALPTNGDTTTLSNSLYTQIFLRSGVDPTSIAVGSTDGQAVAVASVPATPGETPAPQAVPFQAAAQGQLGNIKNMFTSFERVIRPVSISTVSLKAGEGGALTVNVSGETYYVPADSVSLGKKPVKP